MVFWSLSHLQSQITSQGVRHQLGLTIIWQVLCLALSCLHHKFSVFFNRFVPVLFPFAISLWALRASPSFSVFGLQSMVTSSGFVRDYSPFVFSFLETDEHRSRIMFYFIKSCFYRHWVPSIRPCLYPTSAHFVTLHILKFLLRNSLWNVSIGCF